MNYELYMGAALAEAAAAVAGGERPDGAVAVVDEAMVARGRPGLRSTGDPTSHAVVQVIREAARRLGRPSLAGVTVFCVVEPCTMCVGALLESDADGVVYALADPLQGACGSTVQLADPGHGSRRLRVVSGILGQEAADLVAGDLVAPSPGLA
ncbi:MAG: nucleoside deaminase [Chloroflexi bacterium]|nr:nucleoside deaminase [Chloroflexota bacterium]